jgi:hypothetical protein
MQSSKSMSELHEILKSLLRESIRLHAGGASGHRLGRADGYVDGFVRALVESGVSDHASILAVVTSVRRELGGAPTGQLEADASLGVRAA